MGANVMCITSSGGMPLFTRNFGNAEPLSFSAMGSLNGVHLFSKSHGVDLMKTETGTSTILWKEYEKSLVLIVISVLNEEEILYELLDTVFAAMVMTVGIEDLKTIKNIERLKRDLRPVYAIIDKILECLDFGDKCVGGTTQIFKHVETILCSENPSLQICLEGYVECIGTDYGCLTLETGCLGVASQAWWELEPTERKLLSHLIAANSVATTAFDIPLFLPHKSPNVRLRLVGVCLILEVWVAVLCGPKPDLTAAQQLAYQVWAPLSSSLTSLIACLSRRLPTSLHLHSSVLGFLLIDVGIGKYLSSVCTVQPRKETRSPSEVLKSFYYQGASVLIKSNGAHTPKETYWCSEYYKVHGLRKNDIILCLMYNSSVPTPTMRLISEETYTLLADVGW